MTLYVKAGADGISVGYCPFAHYVRMVLHEKRLEYSICPCTLENKPRWLVEYYGGSMPALRHRKECYVESDVIVQYLDFFFQDPPLSLKGSQKSMVEADGIISGFFPKVAKYLKHTSNGDDEDLQLRNDLLMGLEMIERQLSHETRTGPYLVDNGTMFTILDCSLAPKLYHLDVGLQEFKDSAIDIKSSFPKVSQYMSAVFERDSFKAASYSKETVIWGWTKARSK